MAWILTTPSSRGIGFALTRHLLETTKVPIVATARNDLESVRRNLLEGFEKDQGDRLTVLRCDVTDESSIASAAAEAKTLFPPKTHHLRLALTVPGILHPEKSPSQLSAANLAETFSINTIGPLLLLKHFSPFLPKRSVKDMHEEKGLPTHATWAAMSARVGSTSQNELGGWYGYRASKAGVNSFVRTFDQFLKISSGPKAIAIALHPGTVRTEFSKEFWSGVKEGKLFTPEFSAERLCSVIKGLEVETGRGRCWDWEGKEIPP